METPHTGNKQAVCILLECILVRMFKFTLKRTDGKVQGTSHWSFRALPFGVILSHLHMTR